jgi:starch phosphorylase
MAYLAIRGSGAVNGVSRLHGAVSRSLFQSLFPRWPTEEVPVSYVTNGIHVPTWRSADAQQLWDGVCTEHSWHGDLKEIETKIRGTSDTTIWQMRTAARKSLIEFIRARYAHQIAIQGASPLEISEAAKVFDPNTLTLGFARRFATYKRPNLLLHDRDRLLRILRDAQRPVQLVIAGKAHPQDAAGQQMIREWNEFIRQSGVQSSVVFLSDYDMLLTTRLVGGVDLWLNTPRRPWEASGTSGMKVLANGGLNLSETDGWWAEAYVPEVGWAIGDGREHGEDPAWDATEAESMYGLLETEVVPDFYERNDAGIPAKWVARVRESMASLTPQYSAHRTVREYTESHYVPAAAAWLARADQNGKLGGDLLRWQQNLASCWKEISFGPVTVTNDRDGMRFEVRVHLGQVDPCAVHVEILADAGDDYEAVRQTMDRGALVSANTFQYFATVEGHRPAADFTPRVVPWHRNASVPLEADHILWQK